MKALNYIVGSLFAVAIFMALRAPTAPPEGNPWYTAVVKSSRPVLVKFGADWCGPCRHMDSVLDEFSSSQVKVVRVDIDEMPDLAQHYGVHSIPRLFLVKDGTLSPVTAVSETRKSFRPGSIGNSRCPSKTFRMMKPVFPNRVRSELKASVTL